MLKTLKLENFKNFKDATLSLGAFTVLVGTNASGKSNLRDAFRFLHGIGRGYVLPDIIGGKWGPGGSEWNEIRGGLREVARYGTNEFTIYADLSLENRTASYLIGVNVSDAVSSIKCEALRIDNGVVFDMLGSSDPIVAVVVRNPETHAEQMGLLTYSTKQPILTQVLKPFVMSEAILPIDSNEPPHIPIAKDSSGAVASFLNSIRFLDLSPDVMRVPSSPGQTVLGDHGEYLASVLQAIVGQPAMRQTLLEWIKELTPLDVVNFVFEPDPKGNITLFLVESDGQKTSAYSASDGTLRFLGILAALLGPTPASVYFVEEIDTGIHPARLHLLIELIEKQVAENKIQVIATTHSPQMLALLNRDSREHASLVYRLEGEPDAHIQRILDIPDARRVLENQDLAKLHSTGWLEDAVSFVRHASNTVETAI
jgi:predicted ATPase